MDNAKGFSIKLLWRQYEIDTRIGNTFAVYLIVSYQSPACKEPLLMEEDELEFDIPLEEEVEEADVQLDGIRYLQIRVIPKSSHYTTSGSEGNS